MIRYDMIRISICHFNVIIIFVKEKPDRVEDAIQVEYTKPLKGSSLRKKTIEEEDTSDKASVDLSESDKDSDTGDLEVDEDDVEQLIPSDEEAPVERHDRERKRKANETNAPASTKKSKTSNGEKDIQSNTAIISQSESDYVPDSFFMEEMDDAVEDSTDVQRPSWSDMSARGRSSSRGGRGGRGRMSRRGIGDMSAYVASGEVTKQEARLLSWQSGVRGRRGGKGPSRKKVSNDQSEGNVSSDGPNKLPPKSYPKNSWGSGSGSRKDFNSNKIRTSAVEATMPRHNGIPAKKIISIDAKPQNKKILFDDK